MQFSEWWDHHETFLLEVISVLKTNKQSSVNKVENPCNRLLDTLQLLPVSKSQCRFPFNKLLSSIHEELES